MTHHQPLFKTTAGEVAGLVGGELEGEPSFPLEGVATLAEAGPKDVSFLGNPKYAAEAASSKAGLLLLPAAARAGEVKAPNRIFVEDPQFAFSKVLELVENQRVKPLPVISDKAVIHYQAVMGPNVTVGPYTVIERAAVAEETIIGPQCYIGEGVKIGRHCRIYPQVVIREGCVIGDRVIIHSGTVIGADGFGFSPDKKTGKLRKIPQVGNVVIGNDVEIGANVAIDRAAVGSTKVGHGTKIDNLVQVAHGVKIGQNCILVSQTGVAGSTELGNHVVLGGQVGLVGHLKIGDGVQVGAQSGVMSDVEKGQVLFGYPARPHREAFKLQVLYGRLPEIYAAIKEIKEKLGMSKTPAAGRRSES